MQAKLIRIKGIYADLSFKDIGSFDSIVIYLDKTQDIQQLRIGSNKIASIGMSYFPMAKWTALIELCLEWNKIGSIGCKYLSLATLQSLKVLNLSGNSINSSAAIHLSKAAWKSLQKIRLSNNYMNEKAVSSISKADWPSLELFDICWNGITVGEAQALQLFPEGNIRNIWLRGNNIDPNFVASIQANIHNKFGQINIVF